MTGRSLTASGIGPKHAADYVIVHKIDRLARNREDDIAINPTLKKHGVKLVSCGENIDDTPSGKLLYGLMAEIAQFYSANLAQEVMKGLVRKAQSWSRLSTPEPSLRISWPMR